MKQSRKILLLILGFFCFSVGFSSIALDLVGMRWVFLDWLDALGPLISFLIRIILGITGIVIWYFCFFPLSAEE